MSKSFTEVILAKLKDQEVEVFCGDTGETHVFSETQRTEKSIIRGTVTDAEGDCLILTVKRKDLAAQVYINSWNIKTVIPVKHPLFVKDIYDDEEFGFPKGKK